MKLKLSNFDALQLTKAIRGGVIDTDKVDFLKPLVRGYNPPKRIGGVETDYYLDCIRRGWGLSLNAPDVVGGMFEGVKEVAGDLYDENRERIESGDLYREMVKDAFFGLVALSGLGYRVTDKGGDFGWYEGEVPECVGGL